MAEGSCRGGKFVSCDQLSLLGTVRLSDADTSLRIAFLLRAVGTDSVDKGIRLSSCAVRSGFSYEAGTEFFLLLEPVALAGCDPQPSVRFP